MNVCDLSNVNLKKIVTITLTFNKYSSRPTTILRVIIRPHKITLNLSEVEMNICIIMEPK